MVTVAEAEKIILTEVRDFGTVFVPFEKALGRVLAENLFAERCMPPYDRVTMDGIAIKFDAYEKGTLSFQIQGVQAAGEIPINIENTSVACIEIMTGAALPENLDTVIRYEDVEIVSGKAIIKVASVRKGQNVHKAGSDKQKGDIVVTANQQITPSIIGVAASIGKTEILVKKLPRVVIISTGNELVDICESPSTYEIRRSNNYTIKAAIQRYGILPDMLHIPDDLDETAKMIMQCLEKYDSIILSGGISMGKFDYLPKALESLNVPKAFHKVQQRPGKPFWFGSSNKGVTVFAFPGNPVSTFFCLHRYFIPWLHASLGIIKPVKYAILNSDINFHAPLQLFLEVKVSVSEIGQLIATPHEGNGSGDYSNLVESDAFMELPSDKSTFKKGEVYRIWETK